MIDCFKYDRKLKIQSNLWVSIFRLISTRKQYINVYKKIIKVKEKYYYIERESRSEGFERFG